MDEDEDPAETSRPQRSGALVAERRVRYRLRDTAARSDAEDEARHGRQPKRGGCKAQAPDQCFGFVHRECHLGVAGGHLHAYPGLACS